MDNINNVNAGQERNKQTKKPLNYHISKWKQTKQRNMGYKYIFLHTQSYSHSQHIHPHARTQIDAFRNKCDWVDCSAFRKWKHIKVPMKSGEMSFIHIQWYVQWHCRHIVGSWMSVYANTNARVCVRVCFWFDIHFNRWSNHCHCRYRPIHPFNVINCVVYKCVCVSVCCSSCQ